MRSACSCLLVAAALVACPVLALAQQPAVTVVPAAKAEQSPQTEADRKLKEIMSPKDGVMKVDAMVPALEQFIRDNPDYPRLSMVYSNLLMFASRASGSTEKVPALADEAMAKYPNDLPLRRSAIRAKLQALKTQKNTDAMKQLALKVLESETDPALLQAAAQIDTEDGPKLLEKAVAERRKNPSTTASPTLDDLTWSYAQTLIRGGRKDEGMKLSQEALEQSRKAIADLEALPAEDKNRSRLPILRLNLGSRYQGMATLLVGSGDYEKALEYVRLAEQAGGDDALAGTARFEELRAGIYSKLGKPDLELESYARSFAASMDIRTRDKIREVAAKNGRKPDEIFERARQIRKQNAKPIAPFELKTMDGVAVALGSIKAKAILVNFFFPT